MSNSTFEIGKIYNCQNSQFEVIKRTKCFITIENKSTGKIEKRMIRAIENHEYVVLSINEVDYVLSSENIEDLSTTIDKEFTSNYDISIVDTILEDTKEVKELETQPKKEVKIKEKIIIFDSEIQDYIFEDGADWYETKGYSLINGIAVEKIDKSTQHYIDTYDIGSNNEHRKLELLGKPNAKLFKALEESEFMESDNGFFTTDIDKPLDMLPDDLFHQIMDIHKALNTDKYPLIMNDLELNLKTNIKNGNGRHVLRLVLEDKNNRYLVIFPENKPLKEFLLAPGLIRDYYLRFSYYFNYPFYDYAFKYNVTFDKENDQYGGDRNYLSIDLVKTYSLSWNKFEGILQVHAILSKLTNTNLQRPNFEGVTLEEFKDTCKKMGIQYKRNIEYILRCIKADNAKVLTYLAK